MCFSTTASFSAAAILGAGGVISMKKANKRSQFMFASIPFLFGIQQAIEGFLWMALRNAEYSEYKELLSYLFLIFAQILWTTWIPLSVLLIEPEERRRNILKIIAVIGIAASLVFGYRLFAFPIGVEIHDHHIQYFTGTVGYFQSFGKVFYILAILLPPFISSVKYMFPLGLLQTASVLLTKFFYEQYLISVWCFFAACLSIMIVMIIQDQKRKLT